MTLPAKIYAIRHNVTGKIYIGRSASPAERYRHHLNRLRRGAHSVEDMQRDFDLYGEDYTFRILDEVRCGEPTGKEAHWMHVYQTRDRRYGYNYKDQTTKGRSGRYAAQEPERGRLLWQE